MLYIILYIRIYTQSDVKMYAFNIITEGIIRNKTNDNCSG